MVKAKPLNIILERKYSYLTLAYNINSGNLKLPNLGVMMCSYPLKVSVPEDMINFPMFIRSLNHEYIHKWLHENVSLKVCHQWDNIDKTSDNYDYYIS